jgi:hypothetical protein
MHEAIPAAKLIAVLRNPIERAFSAYRFAVERSLEDRSFERSIRDELSGYKYSPADALQREYIAHGLYAQQLGNVFKFFPRNQVKVISFLQLKENPSRMMGELFNFLGVSDEFAPKLEIRNATRGGYRFRFIAEMIHRRPSSNIWRGVVRKITPFSLRSSVRKRLAELNRIDSPKLELSKDCRIVLEDYYRSELLELEVLLGKNIFVN